MKLQTHTHKSTEHANFEGVEAIFEDLALLSPMISISFLSLQKNSYKSSRMEHGDQQCEIKRQRNVNGKSRK